MSRYLPKLRPQLWDDGAWSRFGEQISGGDPVRGHSMSTVAHARSVGAVARGSSTVAPLLARSAAGALRTRGGHDAGRSRS